MLEACCCCTVHTAEVSKPTSRAEGLVEEAEQEQWSLGGLEVSGYYLDP